MSRPCGFGGENRDGVQGKNDHRSAVNWRGSASTWNCFTDTEQMCASSHLSPSPHFLSPREPGNGDLAASVRPAPSVPSGKLTSASHPLPVESPRPLTCSRHPPGSVPRATGRLAPTPARVGKLQPPSRAQPVSRAPSGPQTCAASKLLGTQGLPFSCLGKSDAS